MKRTQRLVLASIVLGAVLMVAPPMPAQFDASSASNELVVGVREGALGSTSQALEQSVQSLGGEIVDEIPELSAVKLRVRSGNVQAAASTVQSVSGVQYTERNHIAQMLFEPNDDDFDKQWGLKKIEAPRAWDEETGSDDIGIAVADSGLDYTHPELAENYDHSGGFDAIYEDNDPYPTRDGLESDDGAPHGSHVAGIVGAETDNDKGVAGIAQVSVTGVRVLNDEGRGSYWSISKGIVHAAEADDVKIINLSLGGGKSGKVLESAVEFAVSAGKLVVAAAGNTGERGVLYPARYDGAIAVSATNRDDDLASFSSYGPEVELAAPGRDILSTLPTNDYGPMSGTSMAAPHVAGVAGLVWSAAPDLSSEQVREILCDSTKDLGSSGRDEKFGCGRINAYKAVQAAKGEEADRPGPEPSEQARVSVDNGCGASGTSYQVGESISISYSVPEAATVKLYRVGAPDSPELLTTQRAEAGAQKSVSPFQAERAGVETVVLQAETSDGAFRIRACSYAIGDVGFDQAHLRLDRGCDSTYQIGDSITVTARVDKRSRVTIVDFATDGKVTEIVSRQLAEGEELTIPAQVTGPPGRDVLVLRAQQTSGPVVTDACGLTIER